MWRHWRDSWNTRGDLCHGTGKREVTYYPPESNPFEPEDEVEQNLKKGLKLLFRLCFG
jgi:hypothetical protein